MLLLRYIKAKLAAAVPVLLGVSVLVFLTTRLTPGDPVVLMLGSDATPAVVTEYRTSLGLDQPLWIQFGKWLWQVLQGNLGRSLWTKGPVADEVLRYFVNSMVLATASLVIFSIAGIGIGVVAATRQYSLLDKVLTVLALVGVSMPAFWLGVVLIVIFSVNLGWLPPAGMYPPAGGTVADMLRHLILPAVTLAARSTGVVARMTRSSLLEVIRQDYVRTARAKGLSEFKVIFRHALKNGLIPVVTVLGVQFGVLLGRAVVVETVFSWPGLGWLTMRSVLQRDFPVVQASILLVAVVFIGVNLLVDILYGFLDPRITYS